MTNTDIELLITEVKANLRCAGHNLVRTQSRGFTITAKTHSPGNITVIAIHEDSTILVGFNIEDIIWKMVRYLTDLDDT